MNIENTLQIIRSGNGEIRPIINYYTDNGGEAIFIDYLDDEDLRSTILYILTELPRLCDEVVHRIRTMVLNGELSGNDLEWAKEISDKY